MFRVFRRHRVFVHSYKTFKNFISSLIAVVMCNLYLLITLSNLTSCSLWCFCSIPELIKEVLGSVSCWPVAVLTCDTNCSHGVFHTCVKCAAGGVCMWCQPQAGLEQKVQSALFELCEGILSVSSHGLASSCFALWILGHSVCSLFM